MVRSGLRLFQRSPGFAFAAILTIALGMGANTAVFSVIQAVLLRPLPFREPSRLVMIWETHPELARLQASVPDYDDWKASSHSFEQMAAYSLQLMNKVTVLGNGEPFQAQAVNASHNLFALLGVAPLAGHTITAEQEQGRQRVLLISENLWRSRFGADRAVVGRAVRLGPNAFTIAGVVPQSGAFPPWAEMWMPLSLIDPALPNERRFHPLEVVARLKSGVSESQAQAEISAIAARLAREYPATNQTIGASLISLDAQTTGRCHGRR